MKLTQAALAIGAILALAAPAMAQQSSYTPGTVWQITDMKVEPGQFENYMDYLAGDYRKSMELQKSLGTVVSYHIYSVNNPRMGEPDLILAVEFKDYVTTAQQAEIQKKIETAMATDAHKSATASGARAKMRTQIGSVEMQELKFK